MTINMVFKLVNLMIIASVFPFSASAQTSETWDGGGGDNFWGTGNNWADNSAPTGNNFLNFAGTTRLDTTNNLSIAGYRIFFNSGAGAFSLSGNAMSFFDFGGNDPQIQNDSSNTQTINLNITGDNTTDVDTFQLGAVSGDMVFNGTFNMNVNNIRVFSTAGRKITFNNVISSGGSGNRHFVIDGNTIVEFNAANIYAGETQINAGELWIGANGDTPNNNTFVGSVGATTTTAKFFLSDMDGGKTFSRTININPGDGGVGRRTVGGINTSGENTFSGAINRSTGLDNRAVTLFAANGGTVTFAGGINGDDSVLIDADGTGVVKFSTVAKTYTADTFVLDGELLIEGNYIPQAAFVGETSGSDDAALMIGTAGVTEDANVTVRSGNSGVMTVGGRNTSGTATYSGAVTLNEAAVFWAATGGTVDFTGAVTGNNALSLNGSGTVKFSGSSGNDFSSVAVNAGTVELNKSSGTAAIDANVTVASAGTMRNLNTHQISDTANVTVSGVWNLNSFSETINQLALNSGGQVQLGGSSAQLIVNDASGVYAGTFTGDSTVSIVKKGAGTVSITGANTGYAGRWFLVQGTTGMNHNNAAGTGTIFLGETTGTDTATLDSSVAGTSLANAIVVRSGSTGQKTIDNATGSGAITYSGAVTLDASLVATAGGTEVTTFSGIVSNSASSPIGSGKFIKRGDGTVVLGGVNTYTRDTEIDLGTLSVSGEQRDLSGSWRHRRQCHVGAVGSRC